MHYLGPYGSEESQARYRQIMAEHWARPEEAPREPAGAALTVAELILAYFAHCEGYYVKNGKPTNQVTIIRQSLKVLHSLYASLPAGEFSPLHLKACRAELMRQPSHKTGQTLCRSEVNRRTRLIVQAFQWGVSENLVPSSVHHGLTSVKGLARGRCLAPDPRPIGPVPEAIVEQTTLHLTPTLAAMVRLQLATAMRPGEIVAMRACDLNMAGPIWEYRPAEFKTEHHEGASRVIMLGPKAQEIIRPFLGLDISGYLFSPRQSEAERRSEQRAQRKTPLWPSHIRHQEARKRGRPGRKAAGERWHPDAYRKAIAQACDAAFPPGKDLLPEELAAWRKAHRWHPNQLRHSAATAIRRQYGAEAAQAVLGHAELSTTEIYAERDLEAARQIMREIG
jgi:integrase